mgnify:CR=1 FL=1
MKLAFKKPYIYFIVLIFLIYIGLNALLADSFIKSVLIYYKTVNWTKLGISLALTIAIGILVAINSVYFYIRYKEKTNLKKCKNAGVVGGIGTIGGLAAGICPLCVTGLLPLILSVLGISFSFASLPFEGIEIQFAVLFLLIVSLYMLEKK